MRVLRTPDECFEKLEGYPFAPQYLQVDELRIHYVDEGPRDGLPLLLLHGEPSWSYLYRHMIPLLAAEGFRVLAPDLVGFGRSDKPAHIEDYSFQRHVDWMSSWLQQLELTGISLFGQDWGSLIGLRLLAQHPARFERAAIGNGFLPTGDQPAPPMFRAWRSFARWSPWFDCGRIVAFGCQSDLTLPVLAGYNAPFPSARYRAGARAFPRLVPTAPDDPAAPACRAAWEVLKRWDKPFLTCFGDKDPITRGADRYLRELIPGCAGQAHVTVLRAGHFMQEDQGPELAAILTRFVREG